MPTLYVTEFTGGTPGPTAVAPGRKIKTNNVTIGAGSTPSLPFSQNTYLVRIKTDSICSVNFSPNDGVTPVATTADAYFVAGDGEYFWTKPGDMVAVIVNT